MAVGAVKSTFGIENPVGYIFEGAPVQMLIKKWIKCVSLTHCEVTLALNRPLLPYLYIVRFSCTVDYFLRNRIRFKSKFRNRPNSGVFLI